MKTPTIALLRISKRKKKKAKDTVQSATGKKAQVRFTKKKVCQICDPLTETPDLKMSQSVETLSTFFLFCLKWLLDKRHLER